MVHDAVANTFIVSSTGANSDVVGTYGSVNIATDGSYTYTLDNTNGTVQALATAEELTDTFTFTVSDGNGGFTSNTLTITIIGTNDYPEVTKATGGVETCGSSTTILIRTLLIIPQKTPIKSRTDPISTLTDSHHGSNILLQEAGDDDHVFIRMYSNLIIPDIAASDTHTFKLRVIQMMAFKYGLTKDLATNR